MMPNDSLQNIGKLGQLEKLENAGTNRDTLNSERDKSKTERSFNDITHQNGRSSRDLTKHKGPNAA